MAHRRVVIRGVISVVALVALSGGVASVATASARARHESPLLMRARTVPTCTTLAITIHSTIAGNFNNIYRLKVTNASSIACKVFGSPAAQSVAGANHHPVGMGATPTKILGVGGSPGNLTVTLPPHGTVAHYFATYETATMGVINALQSQCHDVAANGVRITFPHTHSVVVPMSGYYVCTLTQVTDIAGMARY